MSDKPTQGKIRLAALILRSFIRRFPITLRFKRSKGLSR